MFELDESLVIINPKPFVLQRNEGSKRKSNLSFLCASLSFLLSLLSSDLIQYGVEAANEEMCKMQSITKLKLSEGNLSVCSGWGEGCGLGESF